MLSKSAPLLVFVLCLVIVPPVMSEETKTADAVLILDISDSMSKTPENWNSTKASVQLAEARRFVYELAEVGTWALGLVEFSTEAHERAGIHLLRTAGHAEAINSAMTGTSRGRTNIAHALSLAKSMLLNSTRGSDVRVIFLVTDGKPTDPDPDPLQAALDASWEAKAAGIVVVTTLLPYSQLGSTDIEFMERLTSRPFLFRYTPSQEELRAWFSELTGLRYSEYAHEQSGLELAFNQFVKMLLVPVDLRTSLLRVILVAAIIFGLFLFYGQLEKR